MQTQLIAGRYYWITDIYNRNPVLARATQTEFFTEAGQPVFDLISADTALMNNIDYFNPFKLTSLELLEAPNLPDYLQRCVSRDQVISELARLKNGGWQLLSEQIPHYSDLKSWENIYPYYQQLLDVSQYATHCWLLFFNEDIDGQCQLGVEPLFIGYDDEISLETFALGIGGLSPCLGDVAQLITENNRSVVKAMSDGALPNFSLPIAFMTVKPANVTVMEAEIINL